MGKPVVATRLGAEGYPVTDGRELLLADTPADFAASVVALLHAPERRVELGQAARAFVEQQYDWQIIVPQVEAVYRSAWESAARARGSAAPPLPECV